MARISTYIKDTGLADKDLLVGSNYVSGSVGQEIYETTNFTLDAIKSYIGATVGAWQVFNKTFSGNELVDAFNGNTTDKITLVTVNDNQVAVIQQAHAILKATSTGTTNYALSANNLFIIPEGSIYQWGARLDSQVFINSDDRYGIFLPAVSGGMVSSFSQRPAGADIVLGIPSGYPGVDITAGDRDVNISLTYRLIDFS